MDRIIAEHKARADAAQPSTGSVLSNIASTIAQAAVGGGEVCPAEFMSMMRSSMGAAAMAVHERAQAASMHLCRQHFYHQRTVRYGEDARRRP